jgi:D-glycero-D-manno-heptose 1,7-bisphosphate phosphatase
MRVGMKRPAVFFDRDNTLIACDGYLGDPAKVQLIDGAAQAVARAKKLGYTTVVVSNQSGVARGMYDEAAVHACNARLDELLGDADAEAVIDRHDFCPFHPEALLEKYRGESDRRKPRPGMLLEAAAKLDLDLSKSWMIGDTPRDTDAGKAAGCRTILFHHNGLAPSPNANDEPGSPPDFKVSTLKEALDVIEENTTPKTEGQPPTPQQPPSDDDARRTVVMQMPLPEVAGIPPSVTNEPVAPATSRLESLAEQILAEMRRERTQEPSTEFSVSKLLAGILQIIVLAVLFLTYLKMNTDAVVKMLLLALTLQTMTISLLIMGKQK